ncbi:hypothetical protein FPQ18DRAFT_306152 [Pyronema domesticum]|nr:hypothetical protein FPQ18DRAFT_306152 [Pyronema domesticum]
MAFNKMFSRLVAKLFRPSPSPSPNKSCQSNYTDQKLQNGSGLPHCGHGEFAASDNSLVSLLTHNDDIVHREIDPRAWPSGLIEWTTTASKYEASIALKNGKTFPASPMGDVVRIGTVRSHALPFPHALWRLTQSNMKPLAGIEDRVDSQASYSIQAGSTERFGVLPEFEGNTSCPTLPLDQYLTAPLGSVEDAWGAVSSCLVTLLWSARRSNTSPHPLSTQRSSGESGDMGNRGAVGYRGHPVSPRP